MLKWWWAAGPAAILIAVTALQTYWLQQLHSSKSQQREDYLQRATFLCAAELDHRLSLIQAHIHEAGADIKKLQAAWGNLQKPELVQTIWIIDAANRDAGIKLSRESQTTQRIDDRIQNWLFGTGALRGLPPHFLFEETSQQQVVVVDWNRDYFDATFLPWCFSRALPKPADFHFNIINAATGNSLMGESGMVADSSNHFYPPTRIASPWRNSDSEIWDNPRFTPRQGALHFESTGVLRLEARFAAGNLATLKQNQLLRDVLPAGLSLVFLALTFVTFYTYLYRAQALTHQQAAMVASFSHELRTPLAAIGMAGENLADATVKDEDKVREYGRLITQESRRLGTMVMQALQYSKLFNQRIQENTAHADVAASLAQVAEELTLLLKDKRCLLRIKYPIKVSRAAIEPEALRTILRNLLSNAIKFGPNDQTVDVAVVSATQKRRLGLHISITDQGFGIPKRERRRIYEQFYRGDRARKDQIQGTGLGLSLVRKLVENAHGRIHHQSNESCGTTFTVWLPQSQDSPS